MSSTQTKPAKLTITDRVATLLGCKVENVQRYLYGLGIRQTCGRCGGSGHYSRCQMYGTTCFGCAGRCYVAKKVTREVLAEIEAKIASGELDALKARWRSSAEARKAIGPAMARVQVAYAQIGADYDVFYKAVYGRAMVSKGDWCEQVSRAQDWNNDLRRTAWKIENDVKAGRRGDFTVALADLTEIAELTEALRDAWLAFAWQGPPVAVESAA